MASHHEPLKALAPIDWNDVPQDALKTFINDIFSQAQVVLDSVPSAAKPAATTGRARAKTDSAVVYNDMRTSSLPQHPPATADLSAQLQKEWKEVKTNPKDNPLGINVYKLAGKDGKGAWFARQSVHKGLSFEQWKTGLQREFAESMKVQGSPGSGNIRGIGADRNVEHHQVKDAGHLDVFQLSAQFPGPTAPRDFITLLLTSDFSHLKVDDQSHPLRQYMIVSKPCVHPECPPRQGIIRGQYESVEVVREIPVETDAVPNKRSMSSADLMSGGNRKSGTINRAGDHVEGPRAIEWLMITRSDPGGSVPRFLIEKGTPPGIIGDAGKFLDWVTATTSKDGTVRPKAETTKVNGNSIDESPDTTDPAAAAQRNSPASDTTQNKDTHRPSQGHDDDAGHSDRAPSSTGLYGIINGAFSVAGAVASGLRSQFSNPLSFNSGSQDSLADSQPIPEEHEDQDAESDASSTRSFASALEKSVTGEKAAAGSTQSDESRSQRLQPLEKDLQKLLERRQKLDRNHNQFQERMQSKRQGEKEKDATSLAKLREKHDKEVAKQEAKYKREMRKLEEKREQEERKAEARRIKAAERQEKSSLTLELERVRADKDVALKEIELLHTQVGELQAQNTMLVARLGRLGALNREDSPSSRENSIKSQVVSTSWIRDRQNGSGAGDLK
ncbi:hypothetical protein C2857_006218 [Epichloe festucae Fl1]|uniref:DUF3074 domain-containing protein n=1 Tax=Epichloe festucae (strain Fl1) TaxID=877507 RepID=A0A7S9PW65_EPIFF|nr:hypothetical protein C2857_006218 [Epichloe festucae Fl1]